MPALAPIAILGGASIGGILANAAVAVGIGAIASKFGSKQRADAADDYNIKLNVISNVAAIPVVYGERIVGGTEFRAVSGTNNQYLWRIMVLSEGEIESVEAVYLNGKNVDTYWKYTTLVDWWVVRGIDGQAAESHLLANVPNWTSDHRGYGVAYLVVRLEFSTYSFDNGLPDLTAKIKGRKVYDPRSGLTEWSDNPALCIRDYLTNARYGRGIDPSAIDDASIIASANHCDEMVVVKNSAGENVTQKRYTCNGAVNPDDTSLDIIQKLCTSCRGVIVPPGNQYRLIIDKAEATTFAFTENNILGEWNITGPGSRSMLNRINTRFYDEANAYEEALSVTDSPIHRTEDNGRVLEAEVSLPFTNSIVRSDILAQHQIKQSRQAWRVSFTAPLEALDCTVMDVVSITHPTPGWAAKLFRIQALELRENDTIAVVAEEYDPSVYTFNLNTPPQIPDTGLPDPFANPAPQNLTAASGTAHLLRASDGTIISRIYAAWEQTGNPFVINYEIAWKLSASTGWTSTTTSERQHHIAPAADGYYYDMRVRAIYSNGVSDWVQLTGYLVIGKTELPAAPASLAYAAQRDYTREFSWTLNTTDLDVAGYKIRFSSTITDEWEDMTALHDGLLLSSPWETNLLNAGTYRFGMKTIDTTGNESSIARYTVATLEDSPVSSVLAAFYPRLEGWPGTITNGYILANSGDIESTDTETWDGLETSAPTWDDWIVWGSAGNDLTYQYSDIDLAAVLTFRPVISAQGDGSPTYLIDHSTDGTSWNGWVTPSADITCRYLRIKATLSGPAPRLQSMTILLDGKKETEDVEDLDTSTLTGSNYIAAGNIRIPTTYAFTNIKSVQVALQNVGAGWNWELIDKQTTYGPQIKIYNNAGTLADCTIDATIKGY